MVDVVDTKSEIVTRETYVLSFYLILIPGPYLPIWSALNCLWLPSQKGLLAVCLHWHK